MKTMYAAHFAKAPSLARVEIAKETPKTVTVATHENLAGWQYFGKRTSKDKINLFPNKRDAVLYLLGRAKAYVERCQKAVVKANKTVEILEAALAEI